MIAAQQPNAGLLAAEGVQRYHSGPQLLGPYEQRPRGGDSPNPGDAAHFASLGHAGPAVENGTTLLPAGASISQALSFINANRVQNKTLSGPGSVKSSGGSSSQSSREVKWIQPSGPRKPGEGVENEEQGIIAAEQPASGAVVLRITLLAAGFIIGPSGSTVRDIMRVSGCDIKSWTEQPGPRARRPCRVFVLEGEEPDILSAMTIMMAAVERYKELCEGRCCGQAVGRVQRVMGVEFSYQPPPKNVVPFAAALKGHVQRPPRTPTSAFDLLQHPGSFLMAPGTAGGATNGTVSPYAFAPYSNLLLPPPSPTMLPYPAMYSLIPPSAHGGSGGAGGGGGGGATGAEGEYPAGLGGMLGSYDYSQVGNGATPGSDGSGAGLYMYPSGGMGDAGSGVPGGSTPGWVMGSAPGMLLTPPGMMLAPPSPIRYHGMPSPGTPVALHGDPMGAFLGCSPLAPPGGDQSPWQVGGGGGGGASGGISGPKSMSTDQPGSSGSGTGGSSATLDGGSGGGGGGAPPPGLSLGYDFMSGAMNHQPMLGYGMGPPPPPMMTWYSSPASCGMMYSPSGPVGGRPAPPHSPYSQLMAIMPDAMHPGSPTRRSHPPTSPGSRLNPRAAPWGQGPPAQQQQQQQQRRDHLPRQAQPAAAQQQQQQQQGSLAMEQEQSGNGVEEGRGGSPPHPSNASTGQGAAPMSVSGSLPIDSDKENHHMSGLPAVPPLSAPPPHHEPPPFLAKTPKRSSRPAGAAAASGAAGSDTRTHGHPHIPYLDPHQPGLCTPPPRSYGGSAGGSSSVGSCGGVGGGGGIGVPGSAGGSGPGSVGLLSVSAPSTGGMVSPADLQVSPTRFSHHKGAQGLRTCGSTTRTRQPNFGAASDGSPEGLPLPMPIPMAMPMHMMPLPPPATSGADSRPSAASSATGAASPPPPERTSELGAMLDHPQQPMQQQCENGKEEGGAEGGDSVAEEAGEGDK